MGVATGRTEERVLASMGQLSEVALKFERCDDVPLGGVLCALPALLAVGLLRRVRQFFSWPKGYYPLESIFLSLAFLALAGVRSLERLRYQPPGEWGKLVGSDRIPEVKTMRSKIALLCQGPQAPAQWGSQLAQDWMAANAQDGGFYYVDGHVRVYHGSAVLRPRAYVAREQLCLRATLDYWVNAMDGQPFFVITQDFNERLIRTLQEEIVPRLKAELKGKRETTPKHVPLGELPEADRYTRLPSVSKHFVDTLKMVAYRAETALVGLAREKMERPEEVRSLVRQVLQSSGNLIPNEQEKTLTVEVHPLANQAHNQVLRYLCAQLTETETVYPTTDLRLVFEFLGPD